MNHLRKIFLATASVALLMSVSPASAQGYATYGGWVDTINASTNGAPNYFVTGEPGETSGCSIITETCAMSGLWAGYGTEPSQVGTSSQDTIDSSGGNVIVTPQGYVSIAAFGGGNVSGIYLDPTDITFTTSGTFHVTGAETVPASLRRTAASL